MSNLKQEMFQKITRLLKYCYKELDKSDLFSTFIGKASDFHTFTDHSC